MSKIINPGLPRFDRLLSGLVAENSVSAADPRWDHSNEAVISLLQSWFEKLGFSCEVLAVDEVAGKYNLIATLGSGANGLVLAGHTDTVPYDQARWLSDPFELTYTNGQYFGLGTCDMKGFFPIIIEALRELDGAELNQPIIVLATADEESSMNGARMLAEQGLVQARAAVIGEPTSIKPVHMHKGIMMEAIEFRGRTGHSSNPKLGQSTVEAVHGFLGEVLAYREQLQSQYQNANFLVSGPTLNVGGIHGGDSPNRICGHCALNFDIRPLPGMAIDTLYSDIELLTRRVADKYAIEINHRSLVEPVPPFETPRDAELVKVCESLTGVTAEAVAFATEAPFMSALGMETIVMGAGSIDQAHQPNEFLASEQIVKMSQVLQKLIRHYCVEAPSN